MRSRRRPEFEFVYTAPSASAPPTREKRFLHADPLGSPDVVTAADGTVLERCSYEPFGARRDATWSNPTPPSEPELTKVGFTGHEDDTELGLVNMGGRLYDPKLARFLQPDAVVQAPGFSQSWNPYGYVWHSPLRYTDPSGWQVETGQAGQGPPVVSDPYYRDENGEPYVCATPGCNLVTMAPEPPWNNGEDTTGPTPYGAQPQAAPAVTPSQPAWSMSDAQFYSIVTPGNNLNYDVHGVAIPPDPTATLLELGVLAVPFLVELAPALAAAAPELFGALSELGAGLLEGVAPGSAPAYAGAGAGVVAAGERGAGQAEGRGIGKLGDWLRSFSIGGPTTKGGTTASTKEATGFLGSKRVPLVNAPYQPLRNGDTVIGGRTFGGHALDQMQNRGLMPSVVENAIKNGVRSADPLDGRFRFYDASNNVTVIAEGEAALRVITVIPGRR